MSRTDKDMPTLYEPDHRGCPDDPRRRLYGHTRPRDCDLPDRPVRKDRASWRSRSSAGCRWTPAWESVPDGGHDWPPRGCPADFVRAHYHSPMRREARDVLRAAAADWRANGDTDIEPMPRRSRHSAHYYYYW